MHSFEKLGVFYLGKIYDPQEARVKDQELLYSSKNLTTHAVCMGMTGSGKTGLGITLIEEAALDHIPSIIIDPKGDMGNLLLSFPSLSVEEFKPWIDVGEAERKGKTVDLYAEEVAQAWKDGMEEWGEEPKRIQDLRDAVKMEIYTPASRAGVPLSILSSFKAPPEEILLDLNAMRERVLATTSSLLALLGVSADPLKSREHILISTIIDQSWRDGKDLNLPDLIEQVQKPLFNKIGVLDIETFFPAKERMLLSVTLNNLLASSGFQAWMDGPPLDIQQLLYTEEQKPKISVISIAHLSDSERMFFVTLFLNELIVWMRRQPGTSSLRALFYMDEVYGYFPPVASPPSKAPMITLLKQARAFGLGIVLCTQNPADLDYKGLSNCGTWFIGRLQTARDRMRVIEGLAAASNGELDTKSIDKLMGEMGKRVFIMRSIYEKEALLFQTRWTLAYLRGPLTLSQIEILTKNSRKDFKEKPISPVDEQKSGGKPNLPSTIHEYYARPTQFSQKDTYYRPFIAGFTKLHFTDRKNNLDEWSNVCLVVEAEQAVDNFSWEDAEEYPQLRQKIGNSPIAEATYQPLPAPLFQEKNYETLKKNLMNYLYQNFNFKIYEFKELKLTSKVGESEADFRIRVSLLAKEKRDEAVEKLRERYEKQILTLKEKIRKAEEKKTVQQMQSWYQKFEAFLSMATTILGALMGKKVTKTTINQAGTTFRRMGRMGKESHDVTLAEGNVRVLQQQLDELEAQLEGEVAKISIAGDPAHLNLDELTIRPLKNDLIIEEVSLVWLA